MEKSFQKLRKKKLRKKAEEVLKKAKTGEEFSELAKEYSDDKGSAANGGDLGYFTKGQMVQPFEDAAFSLKSGEISDIVESEYGYHIIKVYDKIDEQLPFDEVKDEIKTTLTENKYIKNIEEISKKAKVEKNEAVIKKVNILDFKKLCIVIHSFFCIFFLSLVKIRLKLLTGGIIKMRATGIVRRIDDLGRVVIPKEIRKTLRIREGDPLEIFTAKDGEVILKKYSPIGELNEFSQEYAETLGETLGCGVIVTDLDSIIAVSKLPKKDYKEKSISDDLEQLIENRESKTFKDSKLVPLHKDDAMEYKHQIIMPIVSSSGDCIGSIVLISKESDIISEADERILKIAANFLGKQVQ